MADDGVTWTARRVDDDLVAIEERASVLRRQAAEAEPLAAIPSRADIASWQTEAAPSEPAPVSERLRAVVLRIEEVDAILGRLLHGDGPEPATQPSFPHSIEGMLPRLEVLALAASMSAVALTQRIGKLSGE